MIPTAALVAAVLRVCSTADPAVAKEIVHRAQGEEIAPQLALAVAVVESGVRGGNPLGLGRAALRQSGPDRIWHAAVLLAKAKTLCRGDNIRALTLYHTGRCHDWAVPQNVYALRVMKLAAKIRRLARQEEAK